MTRSHLPARTHRLAAGLVVGLLTVLLGTSRAEATAQIEEVLVLDGRAHRMQATPLEAFLDQLPERPNISGLLSSACWRGYVGTWIIEDQHLVLRGLAKPGMLSSPPADTAIPLSRVFGARKAPIRATWFSGVLRVVEGRVLQYVHMGFGTLYQKTILLTVVEGRVVSRTDQTLANLRRWIGRSPRDMEWVALASKPPPDDGQWHDARLVDTDAFRKAVPSGKTFRTRGLLNRNRSGQVRLWIPGTPGTRSVRIEVLGADVPDTPLTHVELTATWIQRGGSTVLRSESIRLLKPGESMHHASFIVPQLEARLAAAAAKGTGPEHIPVIKETGLLWAWGRAVELTGSLKLEGTPTLCGVEVHADAALKGKPARARGLLQKWIITKRALATNKQVAALFGKRGPGTYFRLVDPATGALVRALAP